MPSILPVHYEGVFTSYLQLAGVGLIGILIIRTLYGTIANPLRALPGSITSLFTGLEIVLESVKGRRAYKLEELHKKYGPVVRIGPHEVSLGNYSHLKAVYMSKTVQKDARFYGNASFVGKPNLFQILDPNEHAARRRLSSPPYSMQSIRLLDPLLRERADTLARRLLQRASTSPHGTVDAFGLCGLYSFEVIMQAAFAKRPDSDEEGGNAAQVLRAMDTSAPTLLYDQIFPFAKPTGLGTKLPGPIGAAYKSHAFWVDRSYEMVDEFLKNTSDTEEKYLMTALAKGVDSHLGRKLSHEELVEEAMGYMFAGTGTTSSTLTYLLYELSKPGNEDIQKTLRKEIAQTGDDILAVSHNAYVNAVIKETMRLHPTIISTIPRVLTEPLYIDRYLLPKGTVVGMQNWIHHRDASVFPNPDLFSPERWLQASDAMEQSLTPFGIGRRNCIGQTLAWQELYFAVSSIMRANLQLDLGDEMKPWEMEKVDRFNVAPRGKRLMLSITKRA